MLTAPVSQSLSVSKKPDLLTVRCLAVLFGTHATPADRAAHIDLADWILKYLETNNIATTFEVVHYIALQAVHYKPLQEVHLSRYNHRVVHKSLRFDLKGDSMRKKY